MEGESRKQLVNSARQPSGIQSTTPFRREARHATTDLLAAVELDRVAPAPLVRKQELHFDDPNLQSFPDLQQVAFTQGLGGLQTFNLCL